MHQVPTKGGGYRLTTQNRRKVTYNLIILTLSSKDNRFLDYRAIKWAPSVLSEADGSTSKLSDRVREFPIEVTLYDPEEKVVCVAGGWSTGRGRSDSPVEEKSGLSRTFEYKPRIPADDFPKQEARLARLVSTSI